MAHKTLIDGTAYEISGGKTLVNGTAYSIKNGKTLVGGTAYEVGFGVPCEVTITGDSSYTAYGITNYAAYVKIDGVKYGSPAKITVNQGDTISFCVRSAIKNPGQIMGYNQPGNIYLNGTLVYSGSADGEGTYNYTVQGNIAVNVEMYSGKVSSLTYYYGNLYITEL